MNDIMATYLDKKKILYTLGDDYVNLKSRINKGEFDAKIPEDIMQVKRWMWLLRKDLRERYISKPLESLEEDSKIASLQKRCDDDRKLAGTHVEMIIEKNEEITHLITEIDKRNEIIQMYCEEAVYLKKQVSICEENFDRVNKELDKRKIADKVQSDDLLKERQETIRLRKIITDCKTTINELKRRFDDYELIHV